MDNICLNKNTLMVKYKGVLSCEWIIWQLNWKNVYLREYQLLISYIIVLLKYEIYKEGILEEKNLYLILCVILVIVLIICIFVLVKMYSKLVKQNENLIESISNLGRLNDKLRMDRHDYLNHMQVVYGLMELEEYDEMSSYLRKIYKEMLKTGKAIKTSKPAINALLAAKTSESDSKGIELVIEVKSDLKELQLI